MRPLSTLFALPFVMLAGAVSPDAQLRSPGRPASDTATLSGQVPVVLLTPPDVQALQVDEEADELGPFRYGVQLETSLGLDDAGRWDQEPITGALVWRVEIASPGALSLGVFFDEFELTQGSQLFLYDPEREQVLGAYTARNNNDNGALTIQPVRGDRVVLELVLQASSVQDLPRLHVGEVIYDYRDVLAELSKSALAPRAGLGGVIGGSGGSQRSTACLVDINCPAGAEHQDLKRAVVMLLGGAGGCSGSILNNTAEDGTPFLYTAQHCGDMTNAVIIFGYELSGCGSGTSSQSKTLSGATFLAESSFLDSQLYRLAQAPPPSYEPFYAGWNAGGKPEAPTVGISHPSLFPKKIQIDNDPLFTLPNLWQAIWEVGMIQGGSSGSPLLDVHKRVVGTLSAGVNGCGANTAQYGRFDKFYLQKNLETFLDPRGWGLLAIDGFDPFSPYLRPYNGGGGNPEIYSSSTAPALGSTWSADVDTSAVPGASGALIVGYGVPSAGQIRNFGELLIDPSSSLQFRSTKPQVGGVSTHQALIPNDPSLAAFVSYTQAFVLGGALTATNGVKLILNP